ncbi:MAG: hypothetical protein QOK47_545 [Actinomycetota bacterium]|jgi:hypothetical protein|nr:hypothetical protein [Actinomycetota bacterium]
MRTVRKTLGLLLLVPFLVTACSGSDVIKGLSDLEDQMVAAQEEQAPDLEVQGAKCPEEVPAKVGTKFQCTVTIEGVEAPYDVTLNSVEGGQGHFDFINAKPIIDTTKVVEFISQRLETQGVTGIDVACGESKVQIVEIGDSIPCTISDDQDTQTIQAVVEDLQGTVSLK